MTARAMRLGSTKTELVLSSNNKDASIKRGNTNPSVPPQLLPEQVDGPLKDDSLPETIEWIFTMKVLVHSERDSRA